jgi:hypothetical protein
MSILGKSLAHLHYVDTVGGAGRDGRSREINYFHNRPIKLNAPLFPNL